MSGETRYQSGLILPWALTMLRQFSPVCAKGKIAGSLRRECKSIGDVEIVLVPHQRELMQYGLDETLERMIGDGWLTRVPGEPWGERYKKCHATALSFPGLTLDIFLASEGNFGNIFAIRTGDKEFSHALVTHRSHGGLMPDEMRQQGGYLWQAGERIECRTEANFFRALGVPIIAPWERTAQTAKEIAAEIEAELG